jgi:uncharacterized membrane protein YdbT with pleckstrin-like domain
MDNKENSSKAENDVPVIKERKRWLFLGLPFTFTKYSLDAKSLKLYKGLFTTTEDDILLFRVMDVTVKRNLFQKVFGLGTMTVISSDKTTPNLEIKNIKRIHEFKDALDERVDNERLRMRFKAGEFVETDFDDNHDNT